MTNKATLTHGFLRATILDHVKDKGAIPLFAAESGSRGWGFSSPDSDYDGRHVFLWPSSRYLSPFPPADQLGFKDTALDLDFEGWELGKVLRSLRKGNPVVLEWVQSPVVYHDNKGFGKALLGAFGSPDLFNPAASVGHYMGMSLKALHDSDAGSPGNHRPKKLFYALRASLAALHTIKHASMPPMAWDDLLLANTLDGDVPPTLQEALAILMAEKVAHGEKHTVPEDSVGHVLLFLKESSERMRTYMDESKKPGLPPEKPYVDFFHHAVETWGTPQ